MDETIMKGGTLSGQWLGLLNRRRTLKEPPNSRPSQLILFY